MSSNSILCLYVGGCNDLLPDGYPWACPDLWSSYTCAGIWAAYCDRTWSDLNPCAQSNGKVKDYCKRACLNCGKYVFLAFRSFLRIVAEFRVTLFY